MSIRVIFTYLALSLGVAYGQTYESPFMAGLSAVFADYNGPMTGDITQVKTFNPGISVGAFAYISDWFNVSLHSAFFPEVIYPISNGEFGGSSLTDITALTQIKFNNNSWLQEDAFLSPYLTTGFGLNMASGNTGIYLPAGLGMRMRVSKNFSLQVESLYKQALNSRVQHIAHTAGFVFSMPSDRPKRKEPTQQKNPENTRPPLASNDKALIDTDGDGVPDDRDQCPDVKGKAMYLGCPPPVDEKSASPKSPVQIVDANTVDTDGDGVPDAIDRCPDVKGLASLNGCPLPEDQYPAGPVVPAGGPKKSPAPIAREDKEYLSKVAKMIHFDSGSKDLQWSSHSVLDKVAEILERNPDYHLEVPGHTDNTGSEKGNILLSIMRAHEVKSYLANRKGIRWARISSGGVADTAPVADNFSEEGRELNRRVEFMLSQPQPVSDNNSNRKENSAAGG